MDQKQAAWNELTKVQFQLDDKMSELEKAKEGYIDTLVEDTTKNLLLILKEEGTLTERDFTLFLWGLVRNVKDLCRK